MTNATAHNAGGFPGPSQPIDVDVTEATIGRLEDQFKEHGEFFGSYSPERGCNTFVVSNPDMIKRVLSTNHRNYQKGIGIDRVGLLLGKGLMVSEGEFWRRQRRMIQPFFHRRAVHNFYDIMRQCTIELIEDWEQRANADSTVNITESISEATLRVVLRSIFSEDLEELEREHPFMIVSDESSRDLRFAARFRALSRPIRGLIERRREASIQRTDLLAMLMRARDKNSGEQMDDKALVDEIMTLIVAGHETTASSLNWLWYLVSTHPETDLAIGSELAALDERERDDPAALLQLQYIKRVIDEALRMYPPGWLLTRRAIENDRLGDYTIPAQSDIYISPYLVHRHPAHWSSPEKFDPQRFAQQQVATRHPFAYIPFGAGPRRCIGDMFAQVEMQIHVALVAQRFRMQYAGETPVTMEALVNLRCKQPLIMRLQRR